MVRFSDIIKIQDRNWITETGPSQERTRQIGEESRAAGSSPKVYSGVDPADYYEKFVARAQEVQRRVRDGQDISPSPILSDLHYVIDKDIIDKLYDYVMSGAGDRKDFITYCVDVSFICLKIGKGMDYDVKELLKLGLAAFLENVGMYRIPDSILNKSRTLDFQEAALVKKHPGFSYDILSRMGEKYKWLADTALQVHERSDGSGYPRGLKGEEILESASIIGLADSFMAMSKGRPYREKMVKTEAVKSIIEASKGLFPPSVIKAFFYQISLFPINSFIRLNNGSIGKVTATDKNQPMRPTVEILYDSSGNKLAKPQTIRLSEMPMLHIESVLNPDEVGEKREICDSK
jgi:HD-GYP domain-containing protein (c-di-GMP phosphodiesterase class II)